MIRDCNFPTPAGSSGAAFIPAERSADGRLALIQAFQKLNICETGNKMLVQPLHLFEVLRVPIGSPLHGDARSAFGPITADLQATRAFPRQLKQWITDTPL